MCALGYSRLCVTSKKAVLVTLDPVAGTAFVDVLSWLGSVCQVCWACWLPMWVLLNAACLDSVADAIMLGDTASSEHADGSRCSCMC